MVRGSDPTPAASGAIQLDQPLTFLDLESTGPFPETDRIVEFAAVTLHPDGRLVRFSTFVNPEIPIPPAATTIHGIRDADVAAAPPFRALASRFYRALDGRDVAGFNLRRFDLPMLAAEFARVGLTYDYTRARIVDVMRIFHLKEPRDLQAAVGFYLGRTHAGHRAAADVDATVEVLEAQIARYQLNGAVAELDRFCWTRPADWLTVDGRIAWRDGMARLTFGRHAGESLQSLAGNYPDYAAWILESGFGVDVKLLISNALNGTFPEKPDGL